MKLRKSGGKESILASKKCMEWLTLWSFLLSFIISNKLFWCATYNWQFASAKARTHSSWHISQSKLSGHAAGMLKQSQVQLLYEEHEGRQG